MLGSPIGGYVRTFVIEPIEDPVPPSLIATPKPMRP